MATAASGKKKKEIVLQDGKPSRGPKSAGAAVLQNATMNGGTLQNATGIDVLKKPMVESKSHKKGQSSGGQSLSGSMGVAGSIEKIDSHGVLTPAESRLARDKKLGEIGLGALLAHFSEPGRKFRDMATFAGISTDQLWGWIKEDPARREAYEIAIEAKAHSYVDTAHDLADRVVEGDLDPRKADVKIKLSQWSASRTQAYQEKRSIEHVVTHKLDIDDLRQRLDQLAGRATQRAVIDSTCDVITHDGS